MEVLAALGQWIIEKLIWLRDTPEVTWSGAGLTALAVLYYLMTKLFALLFRRGGDRAAGAAVKQTVKGDNNIVSGTGDVKVERR